MMIARSKSVLLCMTIAIMLVVPLTSRAKTANAEKEKEQAERQELEKKTLALLNEIASGAWGLKLPENRIFIMSSAADLFWAVDEKRARNLYWEALNSINSLNTPTPKTGEPVSKTEREKIQVYFLNLALKQKLLRQVAARDSQLAMEMLQVSRQVPPRQLASDSLYVDERRFEQEIAGAIAARDPAQRLQLARQSLMLLDKVVKSGGVRKTEIILDQAGIMPLDFLVFRYGKGVAALAKADFNRTRGLADRFDRNELRLLAQLLIVRGLLQPQASSQVMFGVMQM